MKNNKLEEMKREYEDIRVPNELKSRLEQTIGEAREENKKRVKLIHFCLPQCVAGTVVAACLGFIILCNTNVGVARALADVPVLGDITKIVTFRYNDSRGNYELNIDIPKLEDTSKAAKNLNKQILEYTKAIKEDYEEDIKAIIDDKSLTLEDGHESVDTTYKVVTNNRKVLSIRIDTVIAMGGSDSFSKCYNLDKRTGKVLELANLFQEGSDYRKIISENIIKQMDEKVKKNDQYSYFIAGRPDDMGDGFSTIKKDQNFFVKDNGELVIVFDKYEVAPGFMGVQEFTIDKQAIEDILAPNSILK